MNTYTSDSLKKDEYKNRSNKAVLMLKFSDKIFSFIYGYGRTMLKDSTIKKNFGLRTAINLISEESIKSVNTLNISSDFIDTQRQASNYSKRVNNQEMSFSEALLAVTKREIDYQKDEEIKRKIKRACFPIVKKLEEFNFDFQPTVNAQQIKEFSTMSFLNNQQNIIFLGSPGVGKTHLAIGLGIAACEQGIRTLFINCHELILRLTKAQEKGHLERVIRRYERYDFLIIDELGYLPIASEVANLLFQLINGRYERKSTIITTNIPLSSWGTILHNSIAAEAILDRLVYHSHVIKIKGKSYRLASTQR
nr:IS21-like element helper ATPase IstB [Streptococcus sobrinus]